MIKVAICHKNKRFVKALKDMVWIASPDSRTFVFCYYSPEDIICDFFQSKSVDVLIVDEELANGHHKMLMDLFRSRLPKCVLVLTSKSGTVQADLLSTTPYRCLYERDVSVKNLHALNDIMKYAATLKEKNYVWGYVGKVSYKLYPDDVLYISIAKRGSVIHLNPNSAHGKISLEMRSASKLSDLYDEIGCYGFSYAHNSYLVNLQYVTSFSSGEVVMEDGSALSVSRSKREKFEEDFQKYWHLSVIDV